MAEPRGVLITRPEPDAAETAALVAGRGWEPVVAPLTRVRSERVADSVGRDAVLVTSRNALPALLAYRDLKLLAVGAATASRATVLGFRDVVHADGDAAALAALAARVLRPHASLLLAHGRGQGEALTATLRRLGFRVHVRRAYSVATVGAMPDAAASALAQGALHAATFLSAETARTFARLLSPALRPALATVDALAIGQASADVLAPLPWRRVRVSLRPTLEQVLALL